MTSSAVKGGLDSGERDSALRGNLHAHGVYIGESLREMGFEHSFIFLGR